MLKECKWVRTENWKATEVEILNQHLFLTAKPVVFLVNLSSKDFKRKGNKWLVKIQEWVNNNGGGAIVPYSADFEKEQVEAKEKAEGTEKEEKKDKEEAKDDKTPAIPSMLPKIIKAGYKALELAYYFTAGEDEVRCWTIREGTKAPQAAGVIHTDFEKGFICADVMRYDDFVEAGSEIEVKAKGKLKQQGKDYVVSDGDICHFKFNVSQGGKK